MRDDLDAGLITRDVAETVYGVVVTGAHPAGDHARYTLDPDATARRRAAYVGGGETTVRNGPGTERLGS